VLTHDEHVAVTLIMLMLTDASAGTEGLERDRRWS